MGPNLPEWIRVGPVEYRITMDPDEWLRIEHKRQSKGAYGYTENLVATIYLNPEQAPSIVKLTLWHEVMHALCESTMGGPTWDNLDAENREEHVIRTLEAPTLSVLRDNPALVAYLTA